MKIIRKEDAPHENRPDGRVVTTLFELDLPEPVSSAVFYHCAVPRGKFGAHHHAKSHEIIWFPIEGKITVNGITHSMNAWDGVLLEPGDVHGFDEKNCKDIIHFAIRLPATPDKVSVKQ